MTELQFWQQKVFQFFHDPPGKPYASFPGSGGHVKVGAKLFEVFSGIKHKFYNRPPDWATSGADRPILTVPKGTKGPVRVYWPNAPIATHPLAGGLHFDVPTSSGALPLLEGQVEVAEELGLTSQEIEVEEAEIERYLASTLESWRNPSALQRGFLRCWRGFREELILRSGTLKAGNPLWEFMPAETRCPDHSIWDHLKVTTALAFMNQPRGTDPTRDPWFLRFEIGPVQQFIAESRTSRDLWVSSFLFADLIWHAMQPIVELYGPDCIVYPDLCGNPRADFWLHETYREALQPGANPHTFAAILPNAFVALLPAGGRAGHLRPIKELAEQGQNAVVSRWNDLSGRVKEWLRVVAGEGKWQSIWDEQHKHPPIYSTWSAVAWQPPEKITDPATLRGRALPAQYEGFRQHGPEAKPDLEAIHTRLDRLGPWVPGSILAHYERAREAFAFTNLGYLQMERGFDYALTHHQLSVRHALRKQTAPDSLGASERGEKCVMCGRRQALTGDDSATQDLDNTRESARKFWENKKIDPDETGQERLCAICAVKRFLIEADEIRDFNQVWAGPNTHFYEIADTDGKVRVPFPSTSALAAQEFLAKIVTDSDLKIHIDAVVRESERQPRPRTSFPRSLPRLASAQRNPTNREFLKYDPQEVIFPEALESKARQLKKEKAWEGLINAVKDLRRAAREKDYGNPLKRIAVIRMDGDNMKRLLLGDPDMIGARWRDVIHPKAVEQIEKSEYLQGTGWPDLLDAKRLMGPSLHAFISRALANFSHRIVPWVVEHEFSGRLIYTGGDDVLCLAPAEEALELAARLHRLFSAPWIIDTDYDADSWQWRRADWEGIHDTAKARLRFCIPKKPQDGNALRLPLNPDEVEEPVTKPVEGPILPMLGPSASLSAGIAYAHYKTPLSGLLRHTIHLLDGLAKAQEGKRSVALSHYSRGGAKTEFVVHWEPENDYPGYRDVLHVQTAFANSVLAGKLPYKLREIAESVYCAVAGGAKEDLLRALFDTCTEKQIDRSAFDAAFRIWRQGIQLNKDKPECYTDGLLLCRSLSGAGDEEGDDE